MRLRTCLRALLFQSLVAMSYSGSAFADSTVEGLDYSVTRQAGSHVATIKVDAYANLHTPTLAESLGTDPMRIRAENPTMTLALCEVRGKFRMSPGIHSVDARASNAIWKNCADHKRYVYVIPGSTITVSTGHVRSYSESEQVIRQIEDCTDAPCAIELAKNVAVQVTDWPKLELASMAAEPVIDSVRLGSTRVERATPSANIANTPGAKHPIAFAAFMVLGLLGLLTYGIHKFMATKGWSIMRLFLREQRARLATQAELKQLKKQFAELQKTSDAKQAELEAKVAAQDAKIMLQSQRITTLKKAGQNLAVNRDYFRQAHQYVASTLQSLQRSREASVAKHRDIAFENERLRREVEQQKQDPTLKALRAFVLRLTSENTSEAWEDYINRASADYLLSGLEKLISRKKGMQQQPAKPAAPKAAKSAGSVTQRLFAVAVPEPLISVKPDFELDRESGKRQVAGFKPGQELGPPVISAIPSAVPTMRNMPAVRIPMPKGRHATIRGLPKLPPPPPPVARSSEEWDFEEDASAPPIWGNSTMVGIGKRKIPKAPLQSEAAVA